MKFQLILSGPTPSGKVGGKLPIANEGKVKSTLKRESKRPRNRETNAALPKFRSDSDEKRLHAREKQMGVTSSVSLL